MDDTDKYQGKYRIPSARWRGWDYGANAAYFITICTANRERFFGEIVRDEMQLSRIGQMAHEYWLQIPEHFPFILLDQFVIMPNHVHGIIIVDKQDEDCRDAINRVSTEQAEQSRRDAINRVSTAGGITGNKNPMLNDNLSRVVRWYKGRTSFEIRSIHAAFAWQTRFHDRVIRNYDELQCTAEYIYNNPRNWHEDELFQP